MKLISWFFNLNSKLNADGRRRSSLLRTLLIFQLIAAPLLLLTVFLLNLGTQFIFLLPLIFVGLLISQFCNRSGRIMLGGWVAFLAQISTIFFTLLNPNGQTDNLFYLVYVAPFLIVSVLISGPTIGAVAPLLTSLIAAGGLLLIAFLTVHSTNLFINAPSNNLNLTIIQVLFVNVLLILLVGLVSWLSERYMAGIFKQLTLRNWELEQSNRELAAKRELEEQIGDRLNVLAAQVSSASAEQSRGANDQLSGIVEATTTLEELNQTNKQIARAAVQVSGSAQEALQVAEHGEETIKNSVVAMTVLQEKVSDISNSMDDLFRQSQEIDQIIELISGVADETNLLALNATIEAAGAREYGRRFAAVANEVQRLATRTSEAAESVRLVISEVQDAIKKAAGVTKEGLEDATRLSVSANEVGQTIEGMVQMVQNTALLAQQITFSIQQQESAGTQIVDTMRQISNLSRQMTESSQELLHSIFELNVTADKLRDVDNLTVAINSDFAADSSNLDFADGNILGNNENAADEFAQLVIR